MIDWDARSEIVFASLVPRVERSDTRVLLPHWPHMAEKFETQVQGKPR
jgi:hypothetical protein